MRRMPLLLRRGRATERTISRTTFPPAVRSFGNSSSLSAPRPSFRGGCSAVSTPTPRLRRQRCDDEHAAKAMRRFGDDAGVPAASAAAAGGVSSAATGSIPPPSPVPPSIDLALDNESGLATLTIRNPRRKNALTLGMMDQLESAVDDLATWSKSCSNARCVILVGHGGTFCAGLDLKGDASEIDDGGAAKQLQSLPDGRTMSIRMNRITNRLRSLPIVSVSAVDGHAVGGGAELTTATDWRVLSKTASVRFVHALRGTSPGWGGARRLTSIVGRGSALRLLLHGVEIRGESGGGHDGQSMSDDDAAVGDDAAYLRRRFADAIANEGETAYDAAKRIVVDPILALPSAEAVRAIKSAVAAADGDPSVVSNEGELRLLGNEANVAVQGEIDAFASVWGGRANRAAVESALQNLARKGS